MADLFAQEGIEAGRDIFASEGIAAPSVAERNDTALNPLLLSQAPADTQEAASAHKDSMMQLASARFSPAQLDDMRAKGPIGFLEAPNFLQWEEVVPGGMVPQAVELVKLYNTAGKMERGEDLTDDEQKSMNEFIDRTVEMNVRGLSVGGNISYYGSQVPAFMIEFALSGGVGKAAEEGAAKIATRAIEEGVARKVAQKVAGKTANVVARTSLLAGAKTAAGTAADIVTGREVAPQNYIPGYAERRLNDYMAVTDKGEVLLKQSKETPSMSALKAFGYNTADIASEMSGATIGKYLVKPVEGAAGRLLKGPVLSGVQKLPEGLKLALYQAYKAIQPNAMVTRTFSAMGWNGMIEELGEERVGDIMKSSLDMATDKDYSMDDFLNAITPGKDQLLVEAGIIGIMGGVHAATDIATNIMAERMGGDRAAAQETVSNMSAQEKEDFVLQNFAPQAAEQPIYFDMAQAPGVDPVSQSQAKAAQKIEPPQLINSESGFSKAYRDFVNTLQPIEDVTKFAQEKGAKITPGENPYFLSRTYAGIVGQIEHNLKYGTTRMNPETGQFEKTGKGFKQILDDFDASIMHVEGSRDAREKDFNDYLIARRTIEDLIPREDVKVTEQQKADSIGAMARLTQKYGSAFPWFSEYAKELYDYQGRVLHNLVDSGVISEEKYNQITGANKNYIPFQRIMEEEGFLGAVSSHGVFTDANAKKIIKSIHGSEKDIKTPTQSIMRNTARILDVAYRNRVATGIAALSDILPEYIQPTPPIVVKRGTAKMQVSFDAGLRRKLEAAIKTFGNEISREASIRVKKSGYVNGSYSPMEKLVRVRIGTTEGTLAHEVGHMLDSELGIGKRLLADKKIKAELQELGKQRLSGDTVMTEDGEKIIFEDRVLETNPEKYKNYVTSDEEIIANLYDAYVNAPDLLNKIAPNAKTAFEQIIDENPKLSFLKDIKPSVERGTETLEKDVWGPLDFPPQGTITAFINGEKKFYKVSEPLLEAMRNLSPVQMNGTFRLIMSPFRASAQILRAGATLIPEFWIRNVIRDQSTSFLQSPTRPTPIDTIKGLAAIIGKTELYQDWQANGGMFNSYMELDDKGMEKAFRELMRPDGRFMRYAKNPLNIFEDISMSLEQATRIGAFSSARDANMKGIEAALASREATLDFARGGSVARNINQYVPFFNAGVQATDKLLRTFKENPKATMLWGIATVTVPSVLLTGYYLYGAPEDERREYLEIPQWQKDMFWIFKENGQWRRVPKPFAFGYLFGSVPERFMTWGYEGDKPEIRNFWTEFATGVAGTISPVYDAASLFPPLVKVAVEDLTNYNFFTGRDIYPQWMEDLAPEERSNKFTSETAKFLGQRLGVSPALVDNTLRGQLAGSATYITDAGDKILKAAKQWNGETVPERPVTPSDTPILKAFSVREPTGYGTNSVANFFETWAEISQIHNTFNSKKGLEKQNYREQNFDALRAYAPMKSFHDRIQDYGKRANKVWEDPDMTSQEKVEALSEIGGQLLEAAISGNKWYKDNQGEGK